ncbi:hypothetical protein HYX10_03505 [Candidatus Woesearchaeota archaeon]|nr:hypothetical protein [Candidatus Woesearchaeota archaeon]
MPKLRFVANSRIAAMLLLPISLLLIIFMPVLIFALLAVGATIGVIALLAGKLKRKTGRNPSKI